MSSNRARVQKAMSPEESSAYNAFLMLRWPETDGAPVCPRCNCHKVYVMCSRNDFRCSECKRKFSATSGTIFANRKLPYSKLISLLHRRELNALQLSKELGIQYRAAWVLCAKLRESYAVGTNPIRQSISTIAGYFQHNHKMPDHCERCQRPGQQMQRCTFDVGKHLSGWFCPECKTELEQLRKDITKAYEDGRIVKQFQGHVDDHAKEYG